MSVPNPFASPPLAPPAPPAAPVPAAPIAAAPPAPVAPTPAAAVAPPAPMAPPPPMAAVPPAPVAQPLAPTLAPAAPQAPAPAAPTAAPLAPPAVAPPAAPAPAGAPGGYSGVPGMSGPSLAGVQRPGASSPGAGVGMRFSMPKPQPPPQGRFVLRVSGFVPIKGRMKWPKMVFEVFDYEQSERAKRGEPNCAGVKIEKTLWFDQRTCQLFRDLGYPDNTWIVQPDGQIDFPIQAILDAKPAVLCDVSHKEGSTPGQLFAEIEIVSLQQARTT